MQSLNPSAYKISAEVFHVFVVQKLYSKHSCNSVRFTRTIIQENKSHRSLQSEKISDPSIHPPTHQLFIYRFPSNLFVCITFQPQLSFSNHISDHLPPICDLCSIQTMLDFKTSSSIATSVFHTLCEYCNSPFLNLEST